MAGCLHPDGAFSRVCSGTSVHSATGVAASFLRAFAAAVFSSLSLRRLWLRVAAQACGTSLSDISTAPTLRRHESHPVAAGVSLSLKDVAGSQCVCSCGAATLSSHDSSFRSDSSSTSYQWSRGHEGLRSSDGDCIPLLSAPIQKFFVIGVIMVLSHRRWSLKIPTVDFEVQYRGCSCQCRLRWSHAVQMENVPRSTTRDYKFVRGQGGSLYSRITDED